MHVDVPRVAVLLAAYNGMLWIEEQVTSVLFQKEVDVTLYISVDRSTDGTYDWCENLVLQHPNVVLLPYGERFGGAAKNFFRLITDVSFLGFDFIAFSDQDDIWDLDKLKRATIHLRSNNIDAYSSNVTAFWPDGKVRLLDKAQPQVEWDYLFEAGGPGCTYVLSNELARDLKQSIIDNWKALQQVTYHDWYCYAFARSRGYKWYIDPAPSMQYRQHEFNQMGANSSISALLDRFRTIRNGWWFGQVTLIVILVGVQNDPWVIQRLDINKVQLLRLAFSVNQCRRRKRDRLLFFAMCFAMIMFRDDDSNQSTVIR